MKSDSFQFKQFTIHQDHCAMKVGTDGVLLGAWAKGGKRILDIGTGTGLIALMMAQRYPTAQIVGIDIDTEACQQAIENVERSPFHAQIKILLSSLQDFLSPSPTLSEDSNGYGFDAIVSNPPYYINSMKAPDGKRTWARHADTLSTYDLFVGVSRLLNDNGCFSVIVPSDRVSQLIAEGYLHHLYPSSKCHVKTMPTKQPKRCLLSFQKQRPTYIEETTVNMMDSPTERSEWYQKLTADFYL